MTNEKKYPIGGFAPGNYQNRCATCKKDFVGDKRARQCEPCAIEMVGSPLPEQGEESNSIEIEGIKTGKEMSAEEYFAEHLDQCESQTGEKITFLWEEDARAYATIKAKEAVREFVDENIGVVNWKEAARQYIKNRLG